MSATAGEEAARAKEKVLACEKEIGAIKTQLRAISTDGGASNSLTVAWIKTEGVPESAQPSWKVQLSSPVEEADLTKPFDPLAVDSETKENTTTIKFEGVETGQATLTVTGKDQDIPLGSSISYDVATLTARSAEQKTTSEPVVTELPVAILPEKSSKAAEEEEQEIKEATSEDGKLEEEVTVTEATPVETLVQEAVCTITLRLTYQPSAKDQREELYEKLNHASKQKASAVEELRQVALAASRRQQQQQQVVTTTKKPAVQAGFLNKSRGATTTNKPISKWQAWYDKTIGPDSLLRRVMPTAKNYVLFFGLVGFFHFQGQQLALPPPV